MSMPSGKRRGGRKKGDQVPTADYEVVRISPLTSADPHAALPRRISGFSSTNPAVGSYEVRSEVSSMAGGGGGGGECLGRRRSTETRRGGATIGVRKESGSGRSKTPSRQ